MPLPPIELLEQFYALFRECLHARFPEIHSRTELIIETARRLNAGVPTVQYLYEGRRFPKNETFTRVLNLFSGDCRARLELLYGEVAAHPTGAIRSALRQVIAQAEINSGRIPSPPRTRSKR